MDGMILVDVHDFSHLMSAFELMSPLSVSTNYIALDLKNDGISSNWFKHMR